MSNDSDKKKKRLPTQFTPKGTAVFPRLNVPDTKFKKDGAYSLKLRLPEAEARAFLAKYEEMAKENYQEVLEKTKDKIDRKTGEKIIPENDGLPYQLELDKDTKAPTGNILIPFSCNAKYTDKKTGQEREVHPTLVDSQGNPINPAKVNIWGGSVVKVAFFPMGYYNDATNKAGVSFRLQGVQVIKLVQGGSDVQFGKEEGGFVAEEENPFKAPDSTEGGPDASTASKGNF